MDNLLGAEKSKNEALALRIQELEKQMAEEKVRTDTPKNKEPAVHVDPTTANLSAQLEKALSRMNDLEEQLRNSRSNVLPQPGVKGHEAGASADSTAYDSDEEEEEEEEEVITTPTGVKVA